MSQAIKSKNFRRFSGRTARLQQGISIISVLLGLVIAAAVVAVVYNQYTDSQRKARIEAATSDIATMIAGAQKLYGNANQYGAVTTAVAVQSGVVPERMRVAGTTTAQNRYNGAVTFTPATITVANDSLALGYGSVRAVDCQDIIMSVDTLSRAISVGATQVKPNDGQVAVADMATACDSAANVDLTITFGRGQ